jgi:hypothetical protein
MHESAGGIQETHQSRLPEGLLTEALRKRAGAVAGPSPMTH